MATPDIDDDETVDLHVMPLPAFEGDRVHVASVSCWCTPHRDRVHSRVLVHDRTAAA